MNLDTPTTGAVLAFVLSAMLGGGVVLVRMWADMQQLKSDVKELKTERGQVMELLMDIRERMIRVETELKGQHRRA